MRVAVNKKPYMPKITNITLKNECARLAKLKNPLNFEWQASDMAVVVMRTVLTEMGCKEVLTPEHAESRRKVAEAIEKCFTAPVNWKREYMVVEELAPKSQEKIAGVALSNA